MSSSSTGINARSIFGRDMPVSASAAANARVWHSFVCSTRGGGGGGTRVFGMVDGFSQVHHPMTPANQLNNQGGVDCSHYSQC